MSMLREAVVLADMVGRWTLVVLVMLGVVPLATASYQFAIIGLHAVRNHYGKVEPRFPRVAILVPAWNEAAVIDRKSVV